MRGTMKWFNPDKRFGWIALETGEEVFVHFSALRYPTGRTPDRNDDVELDLIEGPGGRQAVRVVLRASRDDPPREGKSAPKGERG